MKADVIFWVAVGLCVASFLLFAGQVIAATIVALRKKAETGAGDALQQTLNPLDAMKQLGELAQSRTGLDFCRALRVLRSDSARQ
jgi:hypothetical protein